MIYSSDARSEQEIAVGVAVPGQEQLHDALLRERLLQAARHNPHGLRCAVQRAAFRWLFERVHHWVVSTFRRAVLAGKTSDLTLRVG